MDFHEAFADPAVFVGDLFGLHVGDVLVEGLQVLGFGSEFVRGVLFFADFLHLGQQDLVLVVDL